MKKNAEYHYIMYADPLSFIRDFMYGKKVLDVGCVGKERRKFQAHKQMMKNARQVAGIDIHDIINGVKSKKYMYADITVKEDVDNVIKRFGTFEAILMSELIEHIGNLTNLFDNVHSLLDEGGRVILTTPNAISAQWVNRRNALLDLRVNAHHICWFDEVTLNALVKRSGLTMEFFVYMKPGGKYVINNFMLSPKIGAVIRK